MMTQKNLSQAKSLEESAAPQSNAVQLAAILVERQKRHGGEMTAQAFKEGLRTGGCGRSEGFIDYDSKGVSIRPDGEPERKYTWAKFIKFCRENGLIEEESIKCNHKPAPKPAAAATMAAPAVTPTAETSTTSESAADAAASTLKPSSPDAPTPLSAPASPADAGAAAQSLSAAAPASLEAPAAFDYTGLDQPTADALRWAEREICDARRDYVARLAQAVYIAHDALLPVANCDGQRLNNNQHSEKTFIQWCASVGLGKDTAYRLLQVAALLNGSTPEEQAVLEAASPSLLYAAAKPSAPAQLVQGVKDGDITTHKQYQDLLAQLRDKEQELAGERASRKSENAAFSELLADEQHRRQAANEAKIKAENIVLDLRSSLNTAKANENFAVRQAHEVKKQLTDAQQRIAELEARPIEVVGADPDEIERRAQVLAEQKTAQIQAELERARAGQKTSDVQSAQRAVYDAVILAAQAMDAAWRSLVPVLTQLAPVEKRETVYQFVNQLMCMKEDALKMIQTEEAPDADHQN